MRIYVCVCFIYTQELEGELGEEEADGRLALHSVPVRLFIFLNHVLPTVFPSKNVNLNIWEVSVCFSPLPALT